MSEGGTTTASVTQAIEKDEAAAAAGEGKPHGIGFAPQIIKQRPKPTSPLLHDEADLV